MNIQDMTTEGEYTHGHSKQDNVASQLNGQADYYATQAHLSQPSRLGDETKIFSDMSRSQRGVNLIETLQYHYHTILMGRVWLCPS
jgi:hypothetical protein